MTEPTEAAASYKDRSTGLNAIGCFQVGLGLLCALLIPLALLPLIPTIRRSLEAAQGRPTDVGAIVSAIVLYTLLAAFFVGTGIGAMRKRRWVRPILLSLSWTWMVVGGLVVTFVAWAILHGTFRSTLEKTQGMTPSLERVILAVMLLFCFLIYIVLPVIFILFYKSPHVRATLEARDPVPRWTDACPVPVLGLSLWLAFTALTMLFVAQRGVFPLFTTLQTGASGVVVSLLLAGLYAYLALAAYRRRPVGWWGPLALMTILTASAATYFLTADINEYFSAVGMAPQQREMLAESGLFGAPIAVGCAASCALTVGFLLWVRRYFVSREVE